MKSNICLVVFFNHNHEKNIFKIKRIYNKRFTNIKIIMPYYRGSDKDCVSVTGIGDYFQSFFAQSYEKFAEDRFTHYVLLADDLLLNPDINEDNILDKLSLKEDEAFISDFSPVKHCTFAWPHLHPIINAFKNLSPELNEKYLMPLKPKFVETFERLGYEYSMEVGLGRGFINNKNKSKSMRSLAIDLLKEILSFRIVHEFNSYTFPYPLLIGYSDFVVCPSFTLKEFCELCKLFAEMKLWVECSVPTALALANSKIKTFNKSNQRIKTLWGRERNLIEKYRSKNRTFEDFYSSLFNEHNYFFIHPVKLSGFEF